MRKKYTGPKVLVYDIETSPIIGHVWGLWENNVALNQIVQDWHLMSWSAKWYTDKNGKTYGPHNRIMYADQRNAPNVENDSELAGKIWKLLDEADVVITQNGKSFDEKKLNARFILNGYGPPSPSNHIDTKRLATKKFAFTSNKLEYMTNKLCDKKKSIHKKFPGHTLWTECLKGNKEAWKEMQAYNEMDTLSLEELYNELRPYDNAVNFGVFNDSTEISCDCGSKDLQKRGYNYSKTGKYQRYICTGCGAWFSDKINLLTKEKRKSLITKL